MKRGLLLGGPVMLEVAREPAAFDQAQVESRQSEQWSVVGHQSTTEQESRGAMRKAFISATSILALALVGSIFWPTTQPDVEHFGDSIYETIWVWRIPAYSNNPSWRVRWSWSDPLRAQARCCRALSADSVPDGKFVTSAIR